MKLVGILLLLVAIALIFVGVFFLRTIPGTEIRVDPLTGSFVLILAIITGIGSLAVIFGY